jgi:putative nucleotidyltransferase with HDIG domain
LHTRDFFAPRTRDIARFEALWKHSLQTASFARKLASADRQSFRNCQTAYVAGLLHDIGKFVIAACPGAVERPHAENHAVVGAYLLGLWGLPESIVSAAELHHSLDLVPNDSFTPLIYVHAGQNLGFPGRSEQLNEAFIARAGKAERLATWKEVLQKVN